MTGPLYGVLADARLLYRKNAARMFFVSCATFVPALGLDALITAYGGAQGWCTAVDFMAAFVLLGTASRMLGADLRGVAARTSRSAAHELTVAAILTATATATRLEVPLLGHFEFALCLPALYLTFMWLLAVPVIVIEGGGVAAALRRSWRLIHGHGTTLWWELGKAYLAFVLCMLLPAIAVGFLPVSWCGALLAPLAGVGYGPFAALAVARCYVRLAAVPPPPSRLVTSGARFVAYLVTKGLGRQFQMPEPAREPGQLPSAQMG